MRYLYVSTKVDDQASPAGHCGEGRCGRPAAGPGGNSVVEVSYTGDALGNHVDRPIEHPSSACARRRRGRGLAFPLKAGAAQPSEWRSSSSPLRVVTRAAIRLESLPFTDRAPETVRGVTGVSAETGGPITGHSVSVPVGAV